VGDRNATIAIAGAALAERRFGRHMQAARRCSSRPISRVRPTPCGLSLSQCQWRSADDRTGDDALVRAGLTGGWKAGVKRGRSGEVRAGGLVRSSSCERPPGWWSAAGVLWCLSARRAAGRPPGLVSGGVGPTAAVLGGESEHGETGEVHSGGEQGEMGSHVGLAAHPRAPAAVAAAHKVRDVALDLGPGGAVGGLPGGV